MEETILVGLLPYWKDCIGSFHTHTDFLYQLLKMHIINSILLIKPEDQRLLAFSRSFSSKR